MLMNLKSKGLAIILSSPSGGGKSSLAQQLLKMDLNLMLSISATTREKRPGEIEGQNYYFKNMSEFEKLKQDNMLLEYARIYNNYYGTPLEPVKQALENGVNVLFDIDWQGALSIKEKLKDQFVSIFILPPSLEVLKNRLETRAQDKAEDIDLRLSMAQDEMKHAVDYDYVVVNDIFDKTLDQLRCIIIAEEQRTGRLHELKNYLNYAQN